MRGIPEKRECPKCKAMHEYQPLIDSGEWKMTCPNCGSKLKLEWERVETDNGPEDCYYFKLEESD